MSKEQVASSFMWLAQLFSLGVYKRSQGRITRQVTFAALAVTAIIAAWRLYATFGPTARSIWLIYGLAGAVLALGCWLSFRLVNLPRFADFLIAVEAEMNKVSWPSQTELIRSSVVVIVVIFVLVLVLFGLDLLWGFLFQWFGVLYSSS